MDSHRTADQAYEARPARAGSRSGWPQIDPRCGGSVHGQAGPTRLRHGLTRTRPTLGAAPVNVYPKTVTPQGLTPTIGWCPAAIRHTLGRWLTYYAAIGALSVLGVLEWPVAGPRRQARLDRRSAQPCCAAVRRSPRRQLRVQTAAREGLARGGAIPLTVSHHRRGDLTGRLSGVRLRWRRRRRVGAHPVSAGSCRDWRSLRWAQRNGCQPRSGRS